VSKKQHATTKATDSNLLIPSFVVSYWYHLVIVWD